MYNNAIAIVDSIYIDFWYFYVPLEGARERQFEKCCSSNL